MRIGLRLRDIGDVLWWTELRDFVTHLEPTSALHRAKYPKSWWWSAEVEFLSAVLMSLQSANWQRGGGKGAKPKPIRRPAESQRRSSKRIDPVSGDELAERRRAMRSEMARRREAAHGRH